MPAGVAAGAIGPVEAIRIGGAAVAAAEAVEAVEAAAAVMAAAAVVAAPEPRVTGTGFEARTRGCTARAL